MNAHGKVSENCVIRRAKWGSAARWLQIGCTPFCLPILSHPVAIWAPKMRIWGPVCRKLPSQG
jgi:hypothetical protein